MHRQALIRNGLKDFCVEIRKCIEESILPWWLQCYNNYYFRLMKALLLDGNKDELKESRKLIKNVLKSLFKSQPVVSILEQLKLHNKLLESTDLTWSRVLYWHCLIQHFAEEENEKHQFLEQILPETKDYCQYLIK